jgi:hypothetical protein
MPAKPPPLETTATAQRQTTATMTQKSSSEHDTNTK